MTILLVILGVALGVASLALLVPLRFVAWGAVAGPRLSAAVEGSWGGVVTVRAALRDGVVVRLLRRPVYRGPLAGASTSKRGREGRRGWRRPGLRFVLRVLRRVAPSLRLRARVAGRVGAAEPTTTARVFGALAAARRIVPSIDLGALRVDWIAPALDLEGQVEGRVWPAAVAWIVASEYARSRRQRAASRRTPMKDTENLFESVAPKLEALVRSNAVVAPPISVEGRHAIPLVELTLSLGGGGGGGEGNDPRSDAHGKGHGAAAAGGSRAVPVAVVVVEGGTVKLSPLGH